MHTIEYDQTLLAAVDNNGINLLMSDLQSMSDV